MGVSVGASVLAFLFLQMKRNRRRFAENRLPIIRQPMYQQYQLPFATDKVPLQQKPLTLHIKKIYMTPTIF
jgi:hypothetical protein